ncbi:MAG: translation elongation factor 4 [Candidatus Omnitrophota bacterium]
MDKQLIRNFSIIAHIDHGKSTLADRILEFTHSVDKRHFHNQLLDDMELEQERGITIKASAVRFNYRAQDGKEYILNLIDTPGHIDFNYEVKKSLAACEGALLVVDASQGIEAQTVANFYLAREHNLAIVPIINKIDIMNADIERTQKQIMNILRFKETDIILASAKEGLGTEEILERIIKVMPAPGGDIHNPLQALVFDSFFDTYKGVVVFIRVFNGKITSGSTVKLIQTEKIYTVKEIGVLRPSIEKVDELSCGEVGYLCADIRSPHELVMGDTIIDPNNPAIALPGYKKVKPMVFCGIYPQNPKDFLPLKEAMEKLRLNDASFVYEPESSQSFGYGFRCGFLGLLHMEIVQERLEREYNLALVLTTPNVEYRIKNKKGEILEIDSPSKFPEPAEIVLVEEPIICALIIVPIKDIEAVIDFAKSRRGEVCAKEYLSEDRIKLTISIPLSEIVVDFYDRIKSITRGYGSFDYEFKDYQPTKLVKLDIMINHRLCDAFSVLIHKDKAQEKGRMLAEKLKDLIPRQLFEINIQAAVGNQIIASQKVRSLGKNVTGKCYGGDITRKRKLWEKQKEGKKRLKQFGNVSIPQEAFLAAIKI